MESKTTDPVEAGAPPEQPQRRSWMKIIILVLLLLLLGAICIPNLVKPRVFRAMNACINNQRQIESAIREYAQENNLPAGTPVPSEDIIANHIKGGMPVCPQGGLDYQISGTVDQPKITCPNSPNEGHLLTQSQTTRDIIPSPAISPVDACLNNKRQMEAAVQQYAREHDLPAGTPVPNGGQDIIARYVEGGMPECPAGGGPYYIVGTVDKPKVVHGTTSANACLNNQRQIDSAIQQYALENNVAAGSPVPRKDVIGRYIKGGMPECPNGAVHYRVSGTVDEPKIVCPNAGDPRYAHDLGHGP